ncbi:MAG TPA: VOC family protein [candidate division Zixibacteria bacterium]|jgi:catechol 2,3-dioxygenase-like lactoylglutathione lyase family enzyme
MSDAPRLNHLIETVIYAEDLDKAERFYRDVLGLRRFSASAAHRFFAVGHTVLLAFDPRESSVQLNLPQHGTTGSGHFAIQIDPDQYDPWLRHLTSHGVIIEKEHVWPKWSARSIYFRDPAGNAVELITRPAWEENFR